MSLSAYVAKYLDKKLLVEVGTSGVLRIGEGGSVLIQEPAIAGLSDRAVELLRRVGMASTPDRFELFLMSRVLGEGPKIFRPTAHQLRYLEQMTLNVRIEDFATPFTTTVVELPDDYRDTKVVPHSEVASATHRPDFAVLHHDKQHGFLLHSLTFDTVGVKSWWRTRPDEEEIEEWFSPDEVRRRYGVAGIVDEEHRVEHEVRRAVLNYCLLLDEVGTKRVGAATPGEYARLVKWCQKNNRHTARNRQELARQGVVYDLDRQVTLHRTVASADDLPADPTGRVVSPHHRRGHYAMVACGVGRSGRRRVRRPPVFVNMHLLAGGSPINTTYRS